MTELTGQVLGGRYRVEAFIGQGGMADVYKVRDLRRAVFLAMKVLHADLAEDEVFIRNFEREAQTLERLQHPNIVRFYGFEQVHDLAFILMDFIDGLTLRREIFLYKNGLRPARILEVMQPVCAALYYAHQLGMIHCDIKPANIITHRNGTVYLTDFGIARRSESATQPLTGVGSPAYMAPEQFENREPTFATDIYSLGIVLYEMLTGGQRPFTGESANASGSTTKRIVWEKKNTLPPSPRVYNKDITPEMEAVVMICLQRSPRRRFRSTLELLQALEMAVRGPQPDDDAQTRVDLPEPAKPVQPASALPEEKPRRAAGKNTGALSRPLTEKPAASAGKPLTDAQRTPTPAGSLAQATEKAPAPVEKPTPPVEKASTTAGKPAQTAEKTPDPQGKPPLPAGKAPAERSAGSGKTPGRRPTDKVPSPPAGKDAKKAQAQPWASIASAARARATQAKAAFAQTALARAAATRVPAALRPAASRARALWQQAYSLPMLRKAPRWLVYGAAALVLALVSLAIYTAAAQPPITSPTQPAPPAAASPASTRAAGIHAAAPTSAGDTPTLPPTQAAASPSALPAGAASTPTGSPVSLPQPTASGGSDWIAFASDRSGSVQVWIMEAADPENRKQVTQARDGACQPAWSPDGESIAYTTPCKGPSVYYPSATIKITRLADGAITDLPVKAPGIAGAFDPAWSPDGQTLLYTAILGEKTEIRAINLADQSMRTLASRGTKNAQPAWSRDGRYISYIFSDDQNWEALWYMDSNGESKERLARSARFSEPAWAPDGMHILASMNTGSNIPTLALIDRSNPTAGATRLLDGEDRMSRASISPDGQWFVFWTAKGGGKPEIIMSSIDGKQIRALTNNDLRDFHPAWGPK